ncbi:MAG: peptidyl-prolyl cis-trans isomerase [Candidatus Sulfotelmatobacter sp.]
MKTIKICGGWGRGQGPLAVFGMTGLGGTMRLAGIAVLAALAISPAAAQVASHQQTAITPGAQPTMAASGMPSAGPMASANMTPVQPVMNKPVVRINGAELTDRDLLREMMTIFPYARQHNGFPKGEEQKIRAGALRMIEFEELVYQEALRRGMTVPPAKLAKAEADFRSQFPNDEVFNDYLKAEMKGSRAMLRKQIRRSLLIEAMMKLEITSKSKVTLAEARAFYEKNPQYFGYPESYSIQTISIMPPDKATEDAKKDAKKRAEDAWQKAKATKSYEEFGMLAEKVSEDDFHVNMGDHKAMELDRLPTEIVKAANAMQPGEVSSLIQLGNFYTCFRLNAHTPAGKFTFEQVKDKLIQNLEKEKSEKLRAGLDKKLRQNAKVEEL